MAARWVTVILLTLNTNFINETRTSSSSNYSVVPTRLDRPRFRHNQWRKMPMVEMTGIKSVTTWLLVKHAEHSVNETVLGWDELQCCNSPDQRCDAVLLSLSQTDGNNDSAEAASHSSFIIFMILIIFDHCICICCICFDGVVIAVQCTATF